MRFRTERVAIFLRPGPLLGVVGVCLLPAIVGPLALNAAEPVTALNAAEPVKTADEAATLSAAQVTAALAFAQEHHPQLGSLIRKLEKRDRGAYEEALVDVSKTCERLARLQSRDPERYAVDLSLWKVDSRIRLLAARMANDDGRSLEVPLRTLLEQRADLRLQQLSLERERLLARQERIDGQVNQLSGNRDQYIDDEVERLRKSVRGRPAPSGHPPEVKTKAESRPAQPSTVPRKPGDPRT